ncbi:MAG: hypothetical protein IJM18_00670 [Clostridia bacterium]|nr:hypothetical protein [Clostridia bacterium]
MKRAAFALSAFIILLSFLSCSLIAKPDVHTDLSEYTLYRTFSDDGLGRPVRLIDESIWPLEITEDMHVAEFKLVHYDPFDPQYLGYMAVDYDDAAYEKEMKRLRFQRQMDVTGYYGSTGFSNYETAAMYTDDNGMGMVYALTDGHGRIIYVLAEFCNYFFDLKYEDYVPAEYLPEGFNAHEFNPYRKEWLEKLR